MIFIGIKKDKGKNLGHGNEQEDNKDLQILWRQYLMYRYLFYNVWVMKNSRITPMSDFSKIQVVKNIEIKDVKVETSLEIINKLTAP